MGFDDRFDGIDEYAARLIKYKARMLIGKYGFTESNREDLEQDLILDFLQRLPKYNADRARFNTFIARVVNHKIATIIEARKAGLRDYRLCNCSLNDRLMNEEGDSVERMETLDVDDYLIRTGRQSRPTSELHDLVVDVRRVMEQLQPKQRELCVRLMNESVTEISRDTGIPRWMLYDFIKKIRAMFVDAGLKAYRD